MLIKQINDRILKARIYRDNCNRRDFEGGVPGGTESRRLRAKMWIRFGILRREMCRRCWFYLRGWGLCKRRREQGRRLRRGWWLLLRLLVVLIWCTRRLIRIRRWFNIPVITRKRIAPEIVTHMIQMKRSKCLVSCTNHLLLLSPSPLNLMHLFLLRWNGILVCRMITPKRLFLSFPDYLSW